MSVSAFELFKIGIGPSSSHTVGPMVAARRFVHELASQLMLNHVVRIEIRLYGSLAATGKGHATDDAVIAGLAGKDPATVTREQLDKLLNRVKQQQSICLNGQHRIEFQIPRDLMFDHQPLPRHANGMTISAEGKAGRHLWYNTYYSIGGGFILEDSEMELYGQEPSPTESSAIPYPFATAAGLLKLCQQHKLSISELVVKNEEARFSSRQVKEKLDTIWQTMQQCIATGMQREGILPGGLEVQRRAPDLHRQLQQETQQNLIASSLSGLDWLNLYALAVNEENAAGGRVVTAPTNGAAGIIPAVMKYYGRYNPAANADDFRRFLLTASAIGSLCKQGASISGAEVGCQGEVGSACAMAAAGLTEVLGGTPEQVEHAAEIALEHHLGMTCDPVAGLVQVPCIERNAIAAVKAVNAAQMSLRGNQAHIVSLDKVIRTMRDTGRDMQHKYKETSMGGLAVNVIEC